MLKVIIWAVGNYESKTLHGKVLWSLGYHPVYIYRWVKR